MKAIGVIGRNSSGKDALIDYLQQRCELAKLSVGDIVREIAAAEDIAPTRENLHQISQRYFERCGRDYFAHQLIARIEANDWAAVGITGIRTPTDVDTLREHFGSDFLLVHVEVGDPRLRYERSRQRGAARDPQTFAAFRRQDEKEAAMFHLNKAIRRADLTLCNDGSLAEFHRQIEEQLVAAELAAEVDCSGVEIVQRA